MTDLMPESAWAEAAASSPDFSESTRPAPLPQPSSPPLPARRAERRPAPALAADVNELLESMARKRVPRLKAVRHRLQQARAALNLAQIEEPLQALHTATSALDFLAGRQGGAAAAGFVQQGLAFTAAAAEWEARMASFLQRHASGVPVARLVGIDLVLESGSLHKRVRQGAHWLAEMDRDLLSRRRTANSAVASRAIDELARRAKAMHERLQAVHRLCGHARRVHGLAEEQADERAHLCETLQLRVHPASYALHQALQPLLHAVAHRPLVPTELIVAIDARHALQVELTQAGAQLARLHAGERELATQLASMEQAPGHPV